jgi:tetratricopeptide (TPR) repeat protein
VLRSAGLIYVAAGDEAGASRIVHALQQIADNYPSSFSRSAVLQVRGELNLLKGRVEEAGRDLQEALSQWRDTLTLWSLARYLESQGEYTRATPLYERLIAEKGTALLQEPMMIWVLAHYQLASCANRSGDTGRARQFAGQFRSIWHGVHLPQIHAAEQMNK